MKLSLPETELNRRLLALVRASLWQPPPEPSLFSDGETDWNALGSLAEKHTVTVLAAGSALQLPEPYLPPRDWIHKAFAFTQRNQHTHQIVNGCLAEAVARLKDSGVSPVLLKGQAYAALYPRPDMRQCGDIDLYVGEKDYRRACEAARETGWECDEPQAPGLGEKHYRYRLRGVTIELHRVASLLPRATTGKKFDFWSHELLSSTGRAMTVDGTEIPLPPPLFDVVFVFIHLYLHFIKGGIGLRHLCDWVMVLHAHAGEIDSKELEARLKDFGFLRAWQILAPIAVDYLGLPEEEFPLYSSRYRPQASRVLSIIMSEGNFGNYSPLRTPRPAGYMAGKFHTLSYLVRRMAPKLPLDPVTVASSFAGFMKAGLSHACRDMWRKLS